MLQRRRPGEGRFNEPENEQFEGPNQTPPPSPGPLGPPTRPDEPPLPEGARNAETPRERAPQPRPPGGGNATPPQSMAPTLNAGSVGSTEGPGMMPFDPMPGASPGALAMPARRGLYGSRGGLQGGGLGMPLDPVSDAASDPISGLMELLMKLRG